MKDALETAVAITLVIAIAAVSISMLVIMVAGPWLVLFWGIDKFFLQ